MSELPTGTVTFLFTDLEGSTRLWEDHPDEMQEALARHDAILRDAIESHRGHVVKTTGDGAHAAFAVASDAIEAAVAAQLAIQSEGWDSTGPLRVRVGIHTGAAEIRDGDYYGTALNRAARLMSVAHGGQVVVSQTTRDLLRDAPVDLVDLGEHRLRDLGEPERVHQVVYADLTRDFPPLRSVENFPSNLPLQTTSFVGRDDDMDEVMEALQSARVVTLTGVGGVGKTRLAIQVAADLLPHYRDGAWLIELGPLNTPDGIPDVLATTLSVQPRQGMSTIDSVIEALRRKETLLVLDNCEHVIGTAARIVEQIVRSCPEVRIVATSREGLGLRGERQITVPSLDLDSSSVELFVDRAREAGSKLAFDDATTPVIAQICTRLDGIPLALELAAARTRMMTPSEIAARLDERFRLLTGGSRTAVERQQTLRQTVDWSYDLLEPQERAMLDRMAVFAGGFTLEAAEAVLSGDGIDALDIFDGVAQLVDKSLVVADPMEDGTRYRLLETIRQYALERLDAAGATDTVRRRHAQWYVTFVEREAPSVLGPDELERRERLEAEIDNLRAALTWAVERDETILAMGLVSAVPYFSLMFRDWGYQLAPFAALALQTTRADEHANYALALAVRSLDHQNHGRFEEAERDAWAAITSMRERNEHLIAPWGALWSTMIFSGRAEEMSAFNDEILDLGSASNDEFEIFISRNVVVGTLFATNRHDEGIELAEQNRILAEQTGSGSLRALAAFALGGALEKSDPERARALFRESAEHGRTARMEYMTAMALARLARVGAGEVDRAWVQDFRSGFELSVESGDPRTLGSMYELYAQVLAANGRPESATVLFAFHGVTSRDATNPVVQSTIERWKTQLRSELGDARFQELWDDGRAMPAHEAIALVRAELDRVIEGVPSEP